MKLFILGENSAAKGVLDKYDLADSTVVYYNYCVSKMLLGLPNVETISIDEILNAEETNACDLHKYQIKHDWYKKADGLDPSVWNGFSMGRISEYFVGVILNTPLKMLYCLEKLRRSNQYSVIITDYALDSVELKMIKTFCGLNRIALEQVNDGIKPRLSLKSPKESRGLFSQIKTILIFLLSEAGYWRSRLTRMIMIRNKPTLVYFPYSSLRRLLAYTGNKYSLIDSSSFTANILERINRIIFPNISPAIAYQNRMSYEVRVGDNDYSQVINGLIFEHILFRWPKYQRYFEVFYSRLKELKAKLLILPFDEPDECRLAIEAAKKLRIRSLAMQHGYFVSLDYIDDLMLADHVIVANSGIADSLVLKGRSKETVSILGLGLPRSRRSCLLEAKRPYVLICSNPMSFQSGFGGTTYIGKYLEIALRACAKMNNMDLVVKIHPSESIEYYQHMLKVCFGDYPNIQLIDSGRITDLIDGALVVVSPISTVIFESLARETPVICLNLLEIYRIPPFDGQGDIVTVFNQQSLVSNLESVKAGKVLYNDYNLISKYIQGAPGREYENRIVGLIDELAGDHQ